MNDAIAFFVGCVTFVSMMLIKIPIKRFIVWLVGGETSGDKRILIKRCNSILFIVTMIVAVLLYWGLFKILDIDHFKLCCSLKAGAIAIALYAAYEQWFGVY